MNIYSDSSHLALKYLKNTEVNINNLLIMTGDFNIRDSLWDPSFPHHSSISNDLIIIANSFNLDLLILTNLTPTRYSDTKGGANSVINLMFLHSRSNKLNNHSIHPNWHLSSNHISLTISIPIAKENIISSRLSIPKNSKEEAAFVKEATVIIKNLNIFNLTDCDKLEDIVNLLELKIEQFKSTADAGITLTHIIHLGWIKNNTTSILVFDIAQFFPSLNHHLLTCILQKAGLDIYIINFFADYLIGRRINYIWNNFSFPTFEVNVGVDQGSAFSPILLAFYLSPFLYILEKHLKNLNIPISIISFMNDGLFISQNKLIDISNSHLFYSYNVITKLLDKFGLIVEHSKTEVFHFNRLHGFFNPSPLNLSSIGGLVLIPKNSWKYLGFIFDKKLSFHQHIDYYSNKAISMVKCMKLLGNSSHSIIPTQKHLLYRCCILSIVLYGFQLWFYNCAPLSYPLKILGKMQRRATIWILGAFKISPVKGIEAIAGLIPIKLHLQKFMGKL